MDSMLKRIGLVIGFVMLFVAGVVSARFMVLKEYGFISFFAVIFGAIPSLIFYIKSIGMTRSWRVLIALALFALLFESFAIYTGVPYGSFEYSSALGPKFFGLAAWCVPFAWIPLVLMSGSLASFFVKKKIDRVLVGTVILLIADMVIDPVAVKLGFWIWENSGSYYGIPVINFLGWAVSGIVGIAIFIYGSGKHLSHVSILGNSSSALMSLAFFAGISVYFNMWIPAVLGVAFVTIVLTFNDKSSSV